MSLHDEHLKDKHLQKALQHAPDSDVAPSESARIAVLDYADKALKTRLQARAHLQSESWFARIKKAFYAWQLPRWQMAGMGSLAASLLVVVMIWHENPDDPIQVDPVQMATAPEADASAEAMVDSRSESRAESSPETKLAQNELATGEFATGEVAKDDVNLAERSPQAAIEAAPTAHAKAKSAKVEATPQAAALEPPADKTVLARVLEAAAGQESDKETDSRAKEVVVTTEVAPAPVTESAPTIASANGSADAASGQTAARAAPMSKAAKKVDDAEQAQPEAKADSPSAIVAQPAVQSSTLALALSKRGGRVLANADIQVSKLRILYLSNAAGNNETGNNETGNNETESRAVDEATGYRKEAVLANGGANEKTSSKSLAVEIEAYNQTMREWHLNH